MGYRGCAPTGPETNAITKGAKEEIRRNASMVVLIPV